MPLICFVFCVFVRVIGFRTGEGENEVPGYSTEYIVAYFTTLTKIWWNCKSVRWA